MQQFIDSLQKLSPLLVQLLVVVGSIGTVLTGSSLLVKGAVSALGLKGGRLEHLGNLLASGGADFARAKDAGSKLVAKVEAVEQLK